MSALLVIWFIAGPFVGAAIGSAKGHTVLGFFLGLLFGPFGWIIALIIGPSRGVRDAQIRSAVHSALDERDETR